MPDTLISFSGGSAAECARRRYEATGERTSPYRAYPERETYSDVWVYQRADGTRYAKRTEVSRWADTIATGATTLTELSSAPEPTLTATL